MQASRLLSLLLFLQARGRASATELAKAFEVSARTIHRDIDQLSAAGIPVYAERGRAGGFQLLDGWRTKLTGLTRAEAETMFLTGLPGPAGQLGLADAAMSARLKLLSALPKDMQPDAERMAQRFHLDPAPWFRAPDIQGCLKTVARAVWDAKFLSLRYGAAAEARVRRLAPLGLVLKAGTWYLVAENTRGSIGTWRVANIRDAEVLPEDIVIPKKFDLAAHWEKAARTYEEGVYRLRADIKLSPRGVELLDMLGQYVKQTAQRSLRRESDGWIACTIPIESEGHAVRDLIRLCDDVEVLGPRTLRKHMRDTLAAMLRRHNRT